MKESQIHREALISVVKMRGGWDNLGWDGVLEMIIEM